MVPINPAGNSEASTLSCERNRPDRRSACERYGKKVSVIVPAYNCENTLGALLDSLFDQTLSRGEYEVIVVDNGSSDRTPDVAKRYPVFLVHEIDIRGSYAARNKGISTSSGGIIAFTDGDCIADQRWLEMGLCSLEDSRASILAGRIQFTTGQHPSLYELYDTIFSLDQEFYAKMGLGATANLFVGRQVFNKVGLFNPCLISSGDFEWCRRASTQFSISYGDKAVVYHPARRTFRVLVAKQARVGFGKNQLMRMTHDISNWLPSGKLGRSYGRLFDSDLSRGRKIQLVLLDLILKAIQLRGRLGLYSQSSAPR